MKEGNAAMKVYHNTKKKKSSKANFSSNDKEIVRPIYDIDGKVTGYIKVPITDWAKGLVI